MEQLCIQEAAGRIRRMEQCFDALQKAEAEASAALWEDAALRDQLLALTRYYESGQWLHDYELDEQGLLPPQLKRGVLAQDAVFDFLQQLSSTSSAPKCQEELTYEKII